MYGVLARNFEKSLDRSLSDFFPPSYYAGADLKRKTTYGKYPSCDIIASIHTGNMTLRQVSILYWPCYYQVSPGSSYSPFPFMPRSVEQSLTESVAAVCSARAPIWGLRHVVAKPFELHPPTTLLV